MKTDNTINTASLALRAADQFVYAAGGMLVCVLAYGVRLF